MNNVVGQHLWKWKPRGLVGGMVQPSGNVRWSVGVGTVVR